jgi:glycine cleavage system H lipoate-binding protein
VDVVAGVPVPGWLFYAANHTWLDAGDDGLWHLGVDAFLAQVVGPVERLAFLAVKGPSRPAVVLTVHGVDLTLTFPRGEAIVAANTHLRSSLEHLTADPFGLGWLFAVRAPAAPSYAGLRRGPAAREWMAGEVRRLSERVHAGLATPGAGRLAADGGRFAPDLLEHLEREEALRLLAEFFPIFDDGRHP